MQKSTGINKLARKVLAFVLALSMVASMSSPVLAVTTDDNTGDAIVQVDSGASNEGDSGAEPSSVPVNEYLEEEDLTKGSESDGEEPEDDSKAGEASTEGSEPGEKFEEEEGLAPAPERESEEPEEDEEEANDPSVEIIFAEDSDPLEVQRGSDFNLLTGVRAVDENGNTLEVVVVDDDGFDINAEEPDNEFTVTYGASHSALEEKETRVRQIVVVDDEEEEESEQPVKIFFPEDEEEDENVFYIEGRFPGVAPDLGWGGGLDISDIPGIWFGDGHEHDDDCDHEYDFVEDSQPRFSIVSSLDVDLGRLLDTTREVLESELTSEDEEGFFPETDEGNSSAGVDEEEMDLEQILLEGVFALDENEEDVDVAIKDDGGIDLTAVYPDNSFTVVYSAVHPETGEEFTRERTVVVTMPIMPLSTTMDVYNHATLLAAVQASNQSGGVIASLSQSFETTSRYTLPANGNLTIISNGIAHASSNNTANHRITFRGLTGSNQGNYGFNLNQASSTLNLGQRVAADYEGGNINHATHIAATTSGANNFTIRSFNNSATTSSAAPGSNNRSGIGMSAGTVNIFGGRLDENSGHHGGAMQITGGSFNMYGGTMNDNNSTCTVTDHGGGALWVTGGTVRIYAGEISGNSSNGTGTGVYITAGGLTMTGGVISEHTPRHSAFSGGAGVYVGGGNVVIGGNAQIINNRINVAGSNGPGAGIHIMGSGTVTIRDNARIAGNQVIGTGTGAGIHHGGTGALTIRDSVIIENNTTVNGAGAGVNIAGNANVTIEGGTIQNNTAANAAGGGINIAGTGAGLITISGGANIDRNTAGTTGGGINIAAGTGRVSMTGGSVSNNIAGTSGGGVHVGGNRPVDLSGTSLDNNRANNGQGGGVNILGNAAVTINNNSTVSGNRATSHGGGINFAGNGTLTIDGVTLNNNWSGTQGGGINHGNATAQMIIRAANVTNNRAVNGGGIFSPTTNPWIGFHSDTDYAAHLNFSGNRTYANPLSETPGNPTNPTTFNPPAATNPNAPNPPTQENWRFYSVRWNGWLSDLVSNSVQTPRTHLINNWDVNGDLRPQLRTFGVTFNLGGATGTVPGAQTISVTQPFVNRPPTDPTRTGYTFAGWALPGTSTPFDFATGAIMESTTLTAQWSVNSYGVTLAGTHHGAQINGTPGTSASPNFGTSVEITAGTRPEYRWNNWTMAPATTLTPNANSNTASFTMPANAVTATANWTQNVAPTITGAATGSVIEDQVFSTISFSHSGASPANTAWLAVENLPSWLNFNNGQLTGNGPVPTSAVGTHTITIRAQNSAIEGGGATGSEAWTGTSTHQIVITVEMRSHQMTINNVSWTGGNLSAASGQTASGQRQRSSVVTLEAGTRTGYSFMGWESSGVTITNSTSPTAATFTMPDNAVTVTARWREHTAPTITGTTFSNVREDVLYPNVQFSITPDSGFPAPITWLEATGDLPPGLTFNTATGVLSGTPTTAGSYTFTISAQNTPPSGSAEAPLVGTATRTVVILPAERQLTIQNNPAWAGAAAGGQMSSGLVVRNTNVILIAGNRSGYQFQGWTTASGVTINNASNPTAANFEMPNAPITVVANWRMDDTPAIDGNPQNGLVAVPYSAHFAVTGFPEPTVAHSFTGSTLGLDLHQNATGQYELRGTPTGTGTVTITITATNPTNTADYAIETYTFIIGRLPQASGSPPHGVTDAPYTPFTFDSGSAHPVPTWAIISGSLPTGMTFNTANGTITGTPALGQHGSYPLTVRATNIFGSDDHSTTLEVYATPVITQSPGPAPISLAEEESYSFTLQATGRPTHEWVITSGAFPAGMHFDPTTGIISGAPAVGSADLHPLGVYPSITIEARNTIPGPGGTPHSVSTTINIEVKIPSYILTVENIPAAGSSSGQTLSGSRERGTSIPLLEGTRTRINGTVLPPTAFGGWTDAAGNPITSPFTMPGSNTTIVANWNAPPIITDYAPPFARENAAYSYTFIADANPAAIWSITSGSLPANMSLNPATGEISGTPLTVGTYTFRIEADNAWGNDFKDVTLVVRPPLFEITVQYSFYASSVDIERVVLAERGSTFNLDVGDRRNWVFDLWTTESLGVTLGDPTQSATSFVVPGNNVVVLANWARNPNGGGSGGGGGGGLPINPGPSTPAPSSPDPATPPVVLDPTPVVPAAPPVVPVIPAPVALDVAPDLVEVVDPEVPLGDQPPEPPSQINGEDNGNDLVEIEDSAIPTPSRPDDLTPQSAWSLINLLLCIFTGLLMLVKLISKQSGKHNRNSRLVTFLPTFAAVVLFILTQDMRMSMQMVDMWTLWMAVIAAVQLVAFFFAPKIFKEDSVNEDTADA